MIAAFISVAICASSSCFVIEATTRSDANTNNRPIIIIIIVLARTFFPLFEAALKGLHVSTESELKADHYRNKQYVKTRLEVNTLASGLDLRSTSPYIAVPITVVIIMIARLPPHALNSMN